MKSGGAALVVCALGVCALGFVPGAAGAQGCGRLVASVDDARAMLLRAANEPASRRQRARRSGRRTP
jgi:hypothetical protein